MLKQRAIDRLKLEVIVAQLEMHLAPLGYKYVKSRYGFRKATGIFEQEIMVAEDSQPFAYDEASGKLQFYFRLYPSIQCSKLDKWVKKELNATSSFRYKIDWIYGIADVDTSLIQPDDSYEPTNSQAFKAFVGKKLFGAPVVDRHHMDQIGNELTRLADSLESMCDPQVLLDSIQPVSLDSCRMLAYLNKPEESINSYKQHFKEIENQVAELWHSDHDHAKKLIKSLESISAEAGTYLNLELVHKFERKINLSDNRGYRLKLATDIGFEETSRLDISYVDVLGYATNAQGETLIVYDKLKMTLLKPNGVLIDFGQLPYPANISYTIRSITVMWQEELQSFICSKYIIGRTGSIIELDTDFVDEKLAGSSVAPFVRVEYDPQQQVYYSIVSVKQQSVLFSIHEREGSLIKSVTIQGKFACLNMKRKELILRVSDTQIELYDFGGKLLQTINHAGHNDYVIISNDGNSLICHGYATKSQHFDLDTGKKTTLWAHPTYLNGYKERFYQDALQNYHLSTAAFSPGDEYLVGGGFNGKYVMWSSKDLQRKELIPSSDAYAMLTSSSTRISKGQSEEIVFTPYTGNIGDETFFVNRLHDITDISFMDHGRYFITHLKDGLMAWDSHGEPQGWAYGTGKCRFEHSKYLTMQTKMELIVFQRRAVDDQFESSEFRKIEKRDSNFRIIEMEVAEEELDQSKEVPTKANVAPQNGTKQRSLFDRLFGRNRKSD